MKKHTYALAALTLLACGRERMSDGSGGMGVDGIGPLCLFLNDPEPVSLDLTLDASALLTVTGSYGCATGAELALAMSGDEAFSLVEAPETMNFEPEFRIAYQPTEPGQHEATLEIDVEDEFETFERIALTGTSEGPHPLVHPQTATVDPSVGACETVQVRVENTGTSALEIILVLDDPLSSADEGLTVEAGETRLAPITACAETADPTTATARIETNSAVVPEIEVTVNIEPSEG